MINAKLSQSKSSAATSLHHVFLMDNYQIPSERGGQAYQDASFSSSDFYGFIRVVQRINEQVTSLQLLFPGDT